MERGLFLLCEITVAEKQSISEWNVFRASPKEQKKKY